MATQANHHQQRSASARTARERALRRRAGACLLLTLAGASLSALSLRAQAPALVWNVTASVPVGLYRVLQTEPAKGDLVVIAPAGAARDMLAAYGALPAGRVLLKQLKATQGDVVCRTGASLTINGALAATAQLTSQDGRALPAWSGCQILGATEILVLAPHALSFDSRYFGPIDKARIMGLARPLLTFPHEGTP